ncbi:MAG: hypothetical protein IPJ18_16880 [Betaproteobacteria bacterium]|nr:hypothetical protein [Betaproteobacteria bacterium]
MALRDEAAIERRVGANLTERETAILRCLATGKSNKLIAREHPSNSPRLSTACPSSVATSA